jgi:ubiquinol-cytochrome c reductase cytochrome c1 subunit
MMISFAKYSLAMLIILSGLALNAAYANEVRCGTTLAPNALPTTKNQYGEYECRKAPIDITDKASLRRGAELFMKSCASCHSLKYMRFDRMATDLSMPPEQLKQFLQLGNAQISDHIYARITPDLQIKMFSTLPPDLTSEARKRSPDWIYSYLLSFYPDQTRPLGVNNTVLPDTTMPNVLESLHQQVGDQAFKAQVGDLVNFLNYVAEPQQQERKIYGIFVILFLLIFLIPVYLLHREYWQDVK